MPFMVVTVESGDKTNPELVREIEAACKRAWTSCQAGLKESDVGGVVARRGLGELNSHSVCVDFFYVDRGSYFQDEVYLNLDCFLGRAVRGFDPQAILSINAVPTKPECWFADPEWSRK